VKNITITLDEKTAASVRIQAAKRGMSVSRYVGEALQQRLRELRAYNEAMRRYLGQKPVNFDFIGGGRPERNELHDRPGLR
jgi:hypothetical protein